MLPGQCDQFATVAEYAGEYHSDELDAVVRVTASGGALLVARRYEARGNPLEPRVRDEFAGPGGVVVAFRRDASGRVAGLAFAAGRVRNVGFARR